MQSSNSSPVRNVRISIRFGSRPNWITLLRIDQISDRQAKFAEAEFVKCSKNALGIFLRPPHPKINITGVARERMESDRVRTDQHEFHFMLDEQS